MASYDGSEEFLEHFSDDLAKYKASAASALKKFETTYNDIMGFGGTADHNKNDAYFMPVGSDFSNSSTSSDFEISSVNESDASLNNVHTIRSNFESSYISKYKSCYRSHEYTFHPKPNLKYHQNVFNIGHNRQCINCLRDRVNYVIPKHVRPISNQHSEKTYVREKNSVDSNDLNNKWSLKVTVPEPFQMTIRDENQKPIQELKRKQLKEKLNEEVEKEMNVKIHSNPVPAHVYVPLYQKMTQSNVEKTERRRKKSAERTKEITKPFNFTPVKKKEHCGSLPDLQVKEVDYVFKANPLPRHILSSSFSERLKHKEALRKLRINKRAQELLKQSALPFSSKRSLNRSISLINLSKDGISKQEKSKKSPHRKDINRLSREQCKKVMEDWNTKIKNLACTKDHSIEQSEKAEKKSYEARYREFLEARNAPFYDIPIRMTTAAMLREQEIRKDLTEKNKSRTEKDPEREKMKKELKEQLITRLNENPVSNFEKDMEEKLQNYRISRRMRQIEYEKELMEMKKRIERKPLLIERQSKNIRKDKSTSTELHDFVNHFDTASHRTLSSASSLASARGHSSSSSCPSASHAFD